MKKFYNILLLMAALSFLVQAALAQKPGSLTGLVVDDKGEVLSYGTVTLHQAPGGALVTGTAVELDGRFSLPSPAPGKYFLRITALGFAPQDLAAIEVSGPQFAKDFGKTALKPDAKMLKEVTVQNLRPLVDVQADKMVVSVEGTAMAAGSTAFEVLAKSPGVWVDQDGNIQLNGRSGVRVMVDGKMTFLNGKQLQTMLEGMPAENLKNLEIIANPTAKFDAEGTSGIININLKKNTIAGLNGSVYGGYQFNREHGFNSGASLNLKQGKWNFFVSADFASRPRRRDFMMVRTFKGAEGGVTRQSMVGGEDGRLVAPSLRFGTDVDLSKNHCVGASFQLSSSFSELDLFTKTSTIQSLSQTRNDSEKRFGNLTVNAHYVGKLDTLGTTLSADVDVVRIQDDGLGAFLIQNAGNSSILENENPTSYQIYSAKADFSRPLPTLKGKFEAGAKASYVQSDNQIDFFKVEGAQRTKSTDRKGDHFLFDENIYAAYATLNVKLNPTWSLQTGLRSEYTHSLGNSVPNNQKNKRSYLDFFPSIFLQQRVTENYQVSYSFSRRINRPRYENLNPAVFFIDANTEAEGNPLLKPQYTNAFQVTQTIKKNYNLILGYNQTKDAMSQVPVPDVANNKIVFQQRNVQIQSVNATLVAPLNLHPKWNFNNNLTLVYQNYKTTLDELVIYNERVMFMAQTNHNVLLPNNFKLEVSGGYQGAGVYNVFRTKANFWVDLGLKKSFLKDQLDVTLTATDLFRSRKMQGTSIVGGSTNEIDMYDFHQGVRLNLRYRFNKGEKFEVKRRNNNLDEVNRAASN